MDVVAILNFQLKKLVQSNNQISAVLGNNTSV